MLVVPVDGDPGGMMARGICGSPAEAVWTMTGWLPGRGPWLATHALILWWDGNLMPEGWDRARRVWFAASVDLSDDKAIAEAAIFEVLTPPLGGAIRIAESLATAGLASRVVRLARVDGRLVEVTP